MLKKKSYSHIKNYDFLFENKPVKIIAVRDSPKIKLVGLDIGPFQEGNEYETKYWIAKHLEKTGIARLRGETLTTSRLYPILHRERAQPASNITSLPEDFFPRLRRVLVDLKSSSKSSPEKMREYEYVQQLSKDIVSCRLKKIIALASTPGHKGQILRNLTMEELELYEELERIISDWRSEILRGILVI
jgi:hypothetical protein